MRSLLARLRRRPGILAAILAGCGILAVLEHVRGRPIEASPATLPELIHAVAGGGAFIESQADLDRVGALAHALVRAEGKTPGPFHLHFLVELDYLEKIRHLIHAPFVGAYANLYCDVWIHSLTTYGTREPTWTLTRTQVRPALELSILLFLLDRLGMERTAWQERFGAVFEATRGMGMHEPPGRARLWDRLLRHAAESPELAGFIQAQLQAYDWNAVEGAEIRFWREISREPSRAAVERLAALPPGAPPPAGLTAHPVHGILKFRELLRTYGAPPPP